jgi:hypothetical protein
MPPAEMSMRLRAWIPPGDLILQTFGHIDKNWVRFARLQLDVHRTSSTTKTANRSLALRSRAALVSVQLAQFWQHPSDGFRRSVGLL